MKRFLSLFIACAMILSMVPAMAESVEYIPAPYTVEEGKDAIDTYFDPVYYVNENGPTIGVTTLGVLKIDGLYFKDSDNDKELDVFEDWRLDAETRAADLVSKMTVAQQAGYAFNSLFGNPKTPSIEACKDENGNILIEKVFPIVKEGETPATMYGMSMFDNTLIVDKQVRSVVYRGTTNYDASVVAAFSNIANQIAEQDSVNKGQVHIPFILISNPISTGYVNYMALAAAVMGDVANGGDYSMVTEYASLDREMWVAQGIRQMYGPQVDLASDPRWVRNSTTYGEVPEVVANITKALVEAYQVGSEGVNEDSVFLSVKHFPGDGSAENGYESHSNQGKNRIYSTPGSLEKYQLVAFQAACDAGVGSIMPCYSMDVADPRSAEQTYKGVTITPEELGSAYNKTIIGTLLRDLMGFDGFINSDSGIMTAQPFGVEEMTMAERYAAVITAGTDVIGSYAGVEDNYIVEALESGLLEKSALDRASYNHALAYFQIGYFENPYVDVEAADVVFEQNTAADGIAEKVYLSQLKSVVLLKNKNNVLPLNDTTKKVYVYSFTGKGADEKVIASLTALFEGKGFTVVEDLEDADIAYLDVAPTYNGSQGSNTAMGVLDLVEELKVPELVKQTQLYNGEKVEVTTLEEVDDIEDIAEEMHEKGGIVIASIKVDQPWILTNLEPYCDGLIAHFGIDQQPQLDVVTGAYAPTGKLPITMVSCNEVIAVEFKTLSDGNTYQICVSPNDVPGYDKDQYIDPAILEKVPGGSYAYCDSEGNYYKAWYGLTY